MTGPLAWTLEDVAAGTGGVVHGPSGVRITAVGTDSRRVVPGSLFVAIVGPRYDGHDFASASLEQGAAAVMVGAGRGFDSTRPRVEVPDPGAALRDLAALRRSELAIPVVAVTGSTGKTSTKDLIGHILSGSWVSPSSYNNEIGVPLTVLATPSDSRYLIAEVGSRGTGQIEWLIPAVRPHVAVVTNLGAAHLETFGTVETLAAAKWELVAGLEPGGTAVLPANELRLARDHAGETVTFGDDRAADVWFADVDLDARGRPAFTIGTGSEVRRVRMEMAGWHQPWNAVAATAAAVVLGVDLDVAVAGLERAVGSPGRMEIHHGSVTVVNDAYNANPDSMEAALRTVAAMPGRHVACVGLMAELGVAALAEHARMGALVRELGFAVVVVVGEEPGLAEAAGPIARRVEDEEEALRVLRNFLRSGDVVLVKASHAIGLESLAVRLMEEAKA